MVSYYTESIFLIVIEAIQNADSYIKANMAYFKSDEIIDALIERALKKVDIEIIISNSDENWKCFDRYNELLEAGGKIFQCGDHWTAGIMHRKSVVVDGDLLLSGSYNWTDHAADRNHEELFIIEDRKIIEQVELKFEETKQISNRLYHTKFQMGKLVRCSKDYVIGLEHWWNGLDGDWKAIFHGSFELPGNPTLRELIELTNSNYFAVKYNDHITDIVPLRVFTRLQHLMIFCCANITDLSPISRLTNLSTLDVAGTNVSDLSPIATLTNIRELNIMNTHVVDLTPVNNVGLKKLFTNYARLVEIFAAKPAFFNLNPQCKINRD